MDNQIVQKIQELVQEIRQENHIVNEIVRDDVFAILKACDCTVLYYPLEGEEEDGCDGCHVVRYVGDMREQFVFINTNNTRERQAFSAAHELGHIWRVDERLLEKASGLQFDVEEVINRFAAELLMPEKLFDGMIDIYLHQINYVGPKIKDTELVRLVAYLMNQFFVPFKAVVIRLVEVGRLQESDKEGILKYKNSQFLQDIIKEEQYTRLGIKDKLINMENLKEFLVLAEKKGTVTPQKAAKIRKEFGISESSDETSMEEIRF